VRTIIPIELHETADYLLGIATIAMPYLVGYAESAPWVAALDVVAGVSLIVMALFTDYRAFRRR
jgi:hypothetical protein